MRSLHSGNGQTLSKPGATEDQRTTICVVMLSSQPTLKRVGELNQKVGLGRL